ncbi:unnamed protein product [Candidula unifasciata]|uniref:Secreted protein n=1 Tax=Candidula unifasciata TaxID=100452 RepID=A0A8S3YYQ3_9EUPU|nr:unnamed protein product [Candidula unifasciata]
MLSVVLIVAAMVCMNSAIVFDGPCHVLPQPVNNNQRNNTVEIPDSCKTGTIAWDYPMGVLRVHLTQPGKSFNLCLVHSSLTGFDGLHVVTGGAYRKVPVPTEGNPTCTPSVKGEAAFLVDASKLQMYMTYIDFSFAFNTVQ